VSRDNFVFRKGKKAPQKSLCISPTSITIFTVKPNQFSTTLAEINFLFGTDRYQSGKIINGNASYQL